MSTYSTIISTGNFRSQTSKQCFSFGKASRFVPQKPMQYFLHRSPDCFYSIPSLSNSRAPSFGIGRRTDPSRLSKDNPAPDTYSLPSDFCSTPRQLANPFGLSHQSSYKVPSGQLTPGPGAYNTPSKMGSEGRKFSFLERTNLNLALSGDAPGPGKYELPKLGLSKEMAFSKSARFPPIKREVSSDFVALPSSLSSRGAKLDFTSSRNSFPYAQSKTPGPGSYKIPSEFGDFK